MGIWDGEGKQQDFHSCEVSTYLSNCLISPFELPTVDEGAKLYATHPLMISSRFLQWSVDHVLHKVMLLGQVFATDV
jgi:hypothetical protein